MTRLSHQLRFVGGAFVSSAIRNHAHRELPDNHGQFAQGSNQLRADDMLCGAAIDRQLLGCQVNPNTAVVELDGADAIDVDFRCQDRFDKIRNRWNDPKSHRNPPCNTSAVTRALAGDYTARAETIPSLNLRERGALTILHSGAEKFRVLSAREIPHVGILHGPVACDIGAAA